MESYNKYSIDKYTQKVGILQVEIIEFFVQQEDQQKLNRQKDINHAQTGKGTDEREDFLQQIRSKVRKRPFFCCSFPIFQDPELYEGT